MTSSPRVTIVTGPIDSGKTGWCRELAAARPECAGLLLLKVYVNGETAGYDALRLPASERLPFARRRGYEPPAWEASQRVGPFSISGSALEAANAWLVQAAIRPGEIIVDEVGPLELGGGGLSPGLEAVLASTAGSKVYLVVRSGCVGAVCRRFGVGAYDLVEVAPGSGKT